MRKELFHGSQSHKNTGPCTHTQEAERDGTCYSACSLHFIQSGTPVHGMVPPSEWVFPLHLNLSGNTLNRHIQRPISMVILNSVKLIGLDPDKGLGCNMLHIKTVLASRFCQLPSVPIWHTLPLTLNLGCPPPRGSSLYNLMMISSVLLEAEWGTTLLPPWFYVCVLGEGHPSMLVPTETRRRHQIPWS